MPKQSKRRYWLIRGYDSLRPIFEVKVGAGQVSRDQIKRLPQALAAKEGLTMGEIVGAYAKRGTRISNTLLQMNDDFPTYMCGSNPYSTATVVDENGKPVPKPRWLGGKP